MPKGRVLAVDDQRYFRELLEGLLREEDYEVRTAASGEEALGILDQESFDIVITDLVMPGMDGSDLVHRVKQKDADQDIVVVTGVVDVKTAVDAMKLGATEYLLKPIDRTVLATSLDNILQRRRLREEHESLRQEHASLLAENIEFLGERTLFTRAAELFSCLEVEALSVRILEGLCRETEARGAVIWVGNEGDGQRFSLAAARGSVRVEEEPHVLDAGELPLDLREGRVRSFLEATSGDAAPNSRLLLSMWDKERLLGLIGLSDKQGGEGFDAVDRSAAEKFLRFGEIAMANALRISSLQHTKLQDPATGAYVYDYFQDVVRGEIEKAGRHGRSLALMKIQVSALEGLRARLGDAGFRDWQAGLVRQLEAQLRASDVLAVDGEGRFLVLFSDADALAAAALRYRAARALERYVALPQLEPRDRPAVDMAVASYPIDGLQLESLRRALDLRLEEERRSPVRTLGLETLPFAELLRSLLDNGDLEREETADHVARFVLGEVVRNGKGRSVLFAYPGQVFADALRAGLEDLRGASSETEVVVVGEGEKRRAADSTVSWISAERDLGYAPFLIRYGAGPAYAMVREAAPSEAGARFFHTCDRALVEHMAMRLQLELAVPRLL